MLHRRLLGAGLVSLVFVSLSMPAQAEVYKYKKSDGTVVYTDKLSDLPKARRAYYNKRRAEREKQRRELERRLGKEEVERREAERKRKALVDQQLAESERQRRLRAIDAQLLEIRKRRKARADTKAEWTDRMKAARKRQRTLLEEFRKTQKAYQTLAIKPSFTLFPGQAKEKQRLLARLTQLEKELDAAIHEVSVVIPTEARKAGVPPGWVR